MPNTAILGNGDVGITSAGNEFSKTFYVLKSDFWTYGTGSASDPCAPILLGGVTIGEQTEEETETDVNLAPTYKNVTASSYHDDFTPDKAVNGEMQQSPSGYGWVSKRPQDEEEGGVAGVQDFWLQLEFEEAITISRYVVKNDGAVRDTAEGRGNNTKAFELQVSGYIDNPGTPYYSPGEMLVDGDGTTKWCSTPAENADGSAVYWAMIDLGEEKEIARWIVKHAQAGGEGANYNTKDFSLQYTTSESPDPANDADWIDADLVEGNTAAITDRNLEEPIRTRYVRLHVTKPENQGNDAVRIYDLELYTKPKDPNAVFNEKQDILNAEIQTQQELVGVSTAMKTWLSSDKNIMVTELTSKGEEDALFQVDTWASDNEKNKKPITAQNDDTSVTVTRCTENKAPDDEKSHVSQAALSTKIIGADDVAAYSDNENGKGNLKFTLKAGETVYIVTSVGGGGRTYHNDGSLWEDAVDPVNGIEGAILFPVGIAPWGMTTDNVYLNEALDAAYNSYVMTQYYDYTKDEEFLTANNYEVYNYFKQAVAFYEAWLEKEDSDKNEDGYEYVLYAGYNEGSWAKNPAVELAALKNTLKHLIQFSEDLGLDEDKRADWIDIYEHLGDQPTTEVNGKTVLALGEQLLINGEWADLPSPIPGDGNAIPLDAVVPGNVYNYFSSPEDLQIVRDTISVFSDRGAWSQINNFPRLFQEAVKSRYDIDTIITKLTDVIDSQMAANLRIDDNTHGIEKAGATEAINSMMLLSEDGITKIFPNWYADKDAKFANLRARGAFTVSAEYDGTAQEAKNVTITSEEGEDMTLVVPWAEGATVKDSAGNVVKTEAGTVPNYPDEKTITFSTIAGETYTVEKGASEQDKPSKTTLGYFLNKAKEHQADGDVDDCVESIKELFAEAIAEGEAVMADENATRDEVMNATFKLMKAIQALDMNAADKTDLEMAVELAQSIDLTKYVEAGQAEFRQALETAKTVLADGDAMQPETDDAWNALVDAISNLRLKADKSTLEDLLNSVADLDLSQYTEESAAVFRTALANAQAVMGDETLSEDDQKTVDDAVQALSDAKDQLQAKDGTDGDGSGNTGNNSNSGNAQRAAKTGDDVSALIPAAGIMAALAGAAIAGMAARRRKRG